MTTSSATSPAPPESASRRQPWSSPSQAVGVMLLCVLARAVTTIRHIEDADSLRFALGVLDYDVTRLQPQFPGYTAFMGFVKLFHALLGSYALAFSVAGGVGLFALIHYGLALAKWRFTEPRGLALAGLMFFNPMLWLLGNRYMSDLSGAACMLAAFYHLSRADSRRHAYAGFFLAGILAGWRLSYAPFLLAPLAFALWSARADLRGIAARLLAGAAGVLAWLIPLIAVTGWDTLVATARHQTAAHFLATGGTYVTENSWPLRVQRLLGHLWTDGLGAWAPGRHPVTLAVAAGAAFLLVRVFMARVRRNDPTGGRPGDESRAAALRLLATSAGIYLLWILLFQNVVHQTRHVLPLVPPLLMLLAAAAAPHPRARFARIATGTATAALLAAYAVTGATLARQHMRPAAIAQAKAYVETFADTNTVIVTAPWVEKCLSAQGVRARFLSVETPEELAALPARLRDLPVDVPLAAVGDYRDLLAEELIGRRVAVHRTFHHNPYVNRLGARIEVFRYEPGGDLP